MALKDHENLVVSNDVYAPLHIAAMATRNDVFGRVIDWIAVKMVGHKRAFPGSRSGHPVDTGPAPMAGMRPPADTSKQHVPLDCDLPITLLGEGMVGLVNPLVRPHARILSEDTE